MTTYSFAVRRWPRWTCATTAAVATAVAALARLDVLVNCAGILRRGAELDPAVFADVVDINLNGSMRTCAAARALLRASGGCIVNTASMLSFFGGALVPGYAASKGGVAQLTKSLAIAYAADGIRVNAIAPGWIATRMTQALQDDPARSRGDPFAHAAAALGATGRRRAGGAVPRLARRGVRHRRDPAGRRRVSDHLS